MKNILNVDIRECEFSCRLEKLLISSGYKTTHDILKKPIQDLLSELEQTYNFGKKCAQELTDWTYSIHSANNSVFNQQITQLAELYALEANVKNSIIEKQKQLGELLRTLPHSYFHENKRLRLVKEV
jgi:hypothetical protein